MCAVSMIMDHYQDEWWKRLPHMVPNTSPYAPLPSLITQQEVDEFRRLLDRAREYDRRNNEPDCELQEKKDALLKLAKQLGVEINFL